MRNRQVRRSVVKHSYINLIQIEYLLGLVSAFFLGAKNYWLVGIFVIITLVLGYGTSYLYWYLIESSSKPKDEEILDRK